MIALSKEYKSPDRKPEPLGNLAIQLFPAPESTNRLTSSKGTANSIQRWPTCKASSSPHLRKRIFEQLLLSGDRLGAKLILGRLPLDDHFRRYRHNWYGCASETRRGGLSYPGVSGNPLCWKYTLGPAFQPATGSAR
jgi:hypothetical protein